MKIENYKLKISKGFTLIEILLYTVIFAVVSGLTVGILLTVTQVQQRESASAEVTGQLNFIMQTVQRLVSGSSNIEMPVGVSTSTLKLRMKDNVKDPTCLSLVDGVVKLAEGPGTNPNDCTTTTSDLTNNRVIVNTFYFKKFVQYPGHDTVSIDLTITYNSINPKSQVQRTLSSAIARVSAATFDSNLLPGSSSFEIGQTGAPWQNLYLSGVLNLGTAASDPAGQNGSIYYNTASSTFRGYKAGAWSELGASVWNSSGNNIYNTNSGNVGIGTTGPTAKLQIDSTDHFLRFYETDGTVDKRMYGFVAVTDQLSLTARNDAGTLLRNIITVKHDGNVLLAETGTGNVGIGTTNPNYKLEVNGSIVGRFGAGDIQLASAPTSTMHDLSTYTKVKEIVLGQGGALRVKFDLVCGTGCATKISACVTAYGRIYKNGTPVGTERSTTASSWTTFSEDIAGLSPGDALQLYIKGAYDSTYGMYPVCSRYFNLYTTPYPGASVTQDN